LMLLNSASPANMRNAIRIIVLIFVPRRPKL
jgi:hypothetical protein